jgi:hypothetical protein
MVLQLRVVVEGSFSTPVQAHAFLETESGVARWRRTAAC